MSAEHDLDAHLQLRTDDASLVGTLLVGPKAPASELTPHVLMVFLEARGVVDRLIDQDAIQTLIEEASAKPGAEHAAVVAKGRPPRHGTPRVLAWKPSIVERIAEIEARTADPDAPGNDDKPGSPSRDAQDAGESDEAVDHYGHSAFIIVKQSDALGTITPPDAGEDGEDIFGEVIAAKQSPTPSYIDAETLELTEDHRVLARNCGRLIYDGSRRSIERTLEIKGDVGFATGHIDFPGPVIVQGGVKDRFRIESMSDTTVRKLVEAAHIRSARDILIERGVAGRDAALLEARRNVTANYFEATTVVAEGDCIVQKEITNCDITARGSVVIENGAIRGGCITAAHAIRAGVVGSVQEVPTEITVGSIPSLDAPLAEIRVLRAKAQSELNETKEELETYREVMDTKNPDAIEKTMGFEFQISELQDRIGKLDSAAARLRNNLAKNTTPSLTVEKRIHGGVIVRMRGHLLRFKDEVNGPFTIRVNRSGEPIIDAPGNERPASEVASIEPDDSLDPLAMNPGDPDGAVGDGAISDQGQQAA